MKLVYLFAVPALSLPIEFFHRRSPAPRPDDQPNPFDAFNRMDRIIQQAMGIPVVEVDVYHMPRLGGLENFFSDVFQPIGVLDQFGDSSRFLPLGEEQKPSAIFIDEDNQQVETHESVSSFLDKLTGNIQKQKTVTKDLHNEDNTMKMHSEFSTFSLDPAAKVGSPIVQLADNVAKKWGWLLDSERESIKSLEADFPNEDTVEQKIQINSKRAELEARLQELREEEAKITMLLEATDDEDVEEQAEEQLEQLAELDEEMIEDISELEDDDKMVSDEDETIENINSDEELTEEEKLETIKELKSEIDGMILAGVLEIDGEDAESIDQENDDVEKDADASADDQGEYVTVEEDSTAVSEDDIDMSDSEEVEETSIDESQVEEYVAAQKFLGADNAAVDLSKVTVVGYQSDSDDNLQDEEENDELLDDNTDASENIESEDDIENIEKIDSEQDTVDGDADENLKFSPST